MIIGGSVSVGAGATSANVLAGEAEGLLIQPAEISVRANHAGAARGDILTQYFSGQQPKTGRSGVGTNVAVTAGVIDQRVDTVLSRMAVIGQQNLRFQNTTAGAIVVDWEFELHED